MRWREWRLQQNANIALREEIFCAVAVARCEIRHLIHLKTKSLRVEERGLLGVANNEMNIVHINQRKMIGVGGGGGGCGGRGL